MMKLISVILLLFVALISLSIGNYDINITQNLKFIYAIFNKNILNENDYLAFMIFIKLRLIRIIAAFLVGGALSLCGAIFQGIFANNMASSYTLGLNSAACFGASVAILLSLASIFTQIFAVLSALISLLFCIFVKNKNSIILAGILIAAFFQSLIALIKFIADPFLKLPQIVFWLLGSFSAVRFEDIILILPLYIFSLVFLFLLRFKINILCVNDNFAKSFASDNKKLRILVIFLCTLLSACAVCLCGIIAFVGVIIAHFVRFFGVYNYSKLLFYSFIYGGIYLIIIDDFARAISDVELPIGVFTSIIGVVILIFILIKEKKC